jgi:tetratricopeptide (TPR) repeat protein
MPWRVLLPLLILMGTGATNAIAFRPDPTPQEMADLTRQIAEEPGNSRPLQYRGLNYAVLGERDKALADYKAAQKISPTQHYLYWSFGWALFELGDYPSAVQVWENVALQEKEKREIGSQWVPYTLALGYWAKGDKNQAFLYFTKAAKLNYGLRDRDDFEQFTDRWTKKEQTMGMQLFDAWQKEVEKPGNHLW